MASIEVILTEDIPKLGHAGDIVKVKAGYGRNYLLPFGKAMLATSGRVREMEHKRRVVEEIQRKAVAGFQAQARHIEGLQLEFTMNASDEGKLFGSVTNAHIADQLAERGASVDRRKIVLPEHIKQVGDYEVEVKLHREVSAKVRVRVQSSGAPPEATGDEEHEINLEAVGTGDSEDSDFD